MSDIHNRPKKMKLMLRRQKERCWLCHEQMAMKDITFDHVIPKSAGGLAEINNLKLAHSWCNHARANSLKQVIIEHDGIVALRWNVGA